MRYLLVVFIFLFSLSNSFGQVTGYVKNGGYLYPTPESSVDEALMHCYDGQRINILGWSRENTNYLYVQIGDKKGYLFHTAVKNSSRITQYITSTIKKEPEREKKNGNEWNGNGSGIIISKNGYIITNYHVIKDSNDIEVEFIINGVVENFNAEIVQVDKVNDLAVIKILDINFEGLEELSYNFKSSPSDVGTKVYAYGYPFALSLMGKEIKVTDGIISSKSGFDGDITTYQITAPIQRGNSGGPLFDDKGNLIGINSSGMNKDITDNVGYSIKSSYIINLLDVMPKQIDLPSNNTLESLPLTEQVKEISKYVVLIKVK